MGIFKKWLKLNEDMNRRDFGKKSLATGAAALFGGMANAQDKSSLNNRFINKLQMVYNAKTDLGIMATQIKNLASEKEDIRAKALAEKFNQLVKSYVLATELNTIVDELFKNRPEIIKIKNQLETNPELYNFINITDDSISWGRSGFVNAIYEIINEMAFIYLSLSPQYRKLVDGGQINSEQINTASKAASMLKNRLDIEGRKLLK